MEGRRRAGKKPLSTGARREPGKKPGRGAPDSREHSFYSPADCQTVYGRVVTGGIAPGLALLETGALFLEGHEISEAEELHILPLAVVPVPRNGKDRDW